MSDKLLQEELSDDLSERLNDSEKNAEKTAYENRAYLAGAWCRFRQNKLTFIGFYSLMSMLLCVIIIPMIFPYTYNGQSLGLHSIGPSLQCLTGTDRFGRDILVRIMWGGRVPLSVGFTTALISLGVGVLYGGVAGYFGGKIDTAMMRFMNMMYSIPDTPYVTMIAMAMGPSVSSIPINIYVFSWMGTARQVRAQIMTLKKQESSLTAKVLGAGIGRIIFKYLIINSTGPIIVSVTTLAPSAIFYEAFLSFLGIDLSAPQASWGTLASEARSTLTPYPLQTLRPILAICLTMLVLNFIGDGLRGAPDPKRREK